jgi:ABC-type transport system substrate-binding protein
MVYASGQDVSNLDPHTGNDYSIASSQKSVYDTLLRYQGNPPNLEKVLAEDVTGSPDAREWTIKIVKNAKFHDGSPVKADAVEYSFARLLRKKKAPAFLFVDYMDETSAKAVDDHTVKITLKKAFAPFEQVLPWLFIVNPAVVKQHDVNGDEGEAWLKDHEAGSGPFVIKRWEVGNLYEFEALPDYWYGWKDPTTSPATSVRLSARHRRAALPSRRATVHALLRFRTRRAWPTVGLHPLRWCDHNAMRTLTTPRASENGGGKVRTGFNQAGSRASSPGEWPAGHDYQKNLFEAGLNSRRLP